MTFNKLGFALSGLQTISFAIIDKAYKKTGETNLISGLGYGLNTQDNSITCKTRFSFEKKKDHPFLILEIQASFDIKKNDFLNKIKRNDKQYVIPTDLAIHFAVLTIGSARGILHAKTEGTLYNEFLLPTIDVQSLIKENVIFEI